MTLKIFKLVGFGLLLGMLSGCFRSKETAKYEGVCNGEAFLFCVKEKPRFSTIQFRMELRVADLLPITITPAQAVDQMPYSFLPFKAYPHHLYDTNIRKADLAGGEQALRNMIVFVDPHRYSLSDFEKISQCLSQHIAAMEQVLLEVQLTNREHFNFPQFAGAVYAGISDFDQVYTGNGYTLTVTVSGQVPLRKKGQFAISGYAGRLTETLPAGDFSEYTPTEDWTGYKHHVTGNTVAEDFRFYKDHQTGVEYWMYK